MRPGVAPGCRARRVGVTRARVMRATALERCARDVVDANAALETLAASTSGRSRAVDDALDAVRRCARRLVECCASDDDDDDDEEDAREARYLRRRTTALERALREARARCATLEAEALEGRSAWTREAKRELERALEATKSAGSTREARRLRAVVDELRSEARGLEEELARAERESARLRRENALLIDATRAARKEFERRDRARDGSRVAVVTPRVRRETRTGDGPAPSPSRLPAFLGSPFGGVRSPRGAE